MTVTTVAYAFLTHTPCKTLKNFAEKLFDKHNMDVYLIIGNNKEYYEKSDKIFHVQIASGAYSEECTLWDKAIHYFRDIHPTYDYVWLIHEDVFVSSDMALKTIQDTYSEYDLLTSNDGSLPIPPACRISKKLMQFIKDDNKDIRKLALNNNFAVHYPMELSTIKRRARWTLNDIKRKENHLYYPVGNYEEHEIYRHYEPDRLYMLY